LPQAEDDGWRQQRPLESNVWRFQREKLEDEDANDSEEGDSHEDASTEDPERFGIEEIDFFPEQEDHGEFCDDYATLARERVQQIGLESGLEVERKNQLSFVKDNAEFEDLRQDIDRLNMVRQIKKRFGSKKQGTASTYDDDDIDSFLAEVDVINAEHFDQSKQSSNCPPAVTIDDKKQAWLDGLLD
jgi:hypothetical protein